MATIKYWDGSAWQYAVVGKQGPVGATGPTGPQPTLSNDLPQALGSASAGTDATASRDDHVHPTTGLGLTSGKLSQFAATTSSELRGVISDETGSGSLVFNSNPTIESPTINTPAITLSAVESTTDGRMSWNQTAKKIIIGDGTTYQEFPSSILVTNARTASYTLVLADKDKLVEMNVASANTLTVPLNSSVAYPVGTQINILQTGAGQTTIAGASGVTVNGTPGLKLRAQWSAATLIKRGTDTWVVIGDLSA